MEPIQIPTTEETLQLIKDAGVLVCLEIKGGNTKRACMIAEKLVELIKRFDMIDKANVCSYFPEAIALEKIWFLTWRHPVKDYRMTRYLIFLMPFTKPRRAVLEFCCPISTH